MHTDGNLTIAGQRMEKVDIPLSAMVPCPKIAYQLRSPRECIGCEFHVGMVDRFPDSQKSFAERFLVGCRGEVKMRQVMTVAALVGAKPAE